MVNLRLLKATLPATFATALLLGATPAGAATGPNTTKQASKEVRGPSGSTGAVTVSCPQGTRAIGGGYQLPEVNAAEKDVTALLPYLSRKEGPRSWKVAAYKLGGGSDPVALTAYVRCARIASPLGVATAHRTLVGNSKAGLNVGSASAKCAPGSHPISGGFKLSVNNLSSSDGPAEVVLSSARRYRAWRVSALRLVQGQGRLTAFAYCGTIVMRNQRVDAALQFKTHSQSAKASRCPRNWALVGGGFVARLVGTQSGAAVALPISSGPLGPRRWGVTAFAEGDTGGPAAPLSVIGYCTRLGARK